MSTPLFTPPEDGWYHLCAKGVFAHPTTGYSQVLDDEALASMVANFEGRAADKSFGGILVDFDHFSLDIDKPSEAAGWITELQIRPDGLYARIRWTDHGEEALLGGRYRYLSPVWKEGDCEQLGEMRLRPRKLLNAALTNDPNIKDLRPLTNRASDAAGLPNARRSVSEMDDDQRRAVMAKLRGGGVYVAPARRPAAAAPGAPREPAGTLPSARLTPRTAAVSTRPPRKRKAAPAVAEPETPFAVPANVSTPSGSDPNWAARLAPYGGDYELYRQAQGIQTADADLGLFAAPGAGRAIAGLLGRAGRIVSSFGSSILSGIGSALVGDYRDAHAADRGYSPTTDHYLAMAQDLLATVSALTGFGAAKGYVGSTTAVQTLGRRISAVSHTLDDLASWAATFLPASLRTAGGRLMTGYKTVAEVTGTDLTAIRGLSQPSVDAFLRAGYITTAMGLVDLYEQSQVLNFKADMGEAWNQGKPYVLDPQANLVAGPLAAAYFAAGTLGNPLEKTLRGFSKGKYTSGLADRAAYELRWEQINEQEGAGQISAQEAHRQRSLLSEKRPWNMAGTSLWLTTPAVAGFAKYLAKDLGATYTHTSVETIAHVLDGDTPVLTGGNPKGVRLLGIDTPETVHPDTGVQYMGPEASALAKRLLPPGQTVRLVTDTHQKAQQQAKYGRDTGYIETLPAPWDKLLAIPVIGKYIPAIDVGEAQLKAGTAMTRYQNLSGPTDRGRDYDAAMQEAMGKKVGLWSPDAASQANWWGYTAKPYTMQNALSAAGNMAGLGLLAVGRSGFFNAMGTTGSRMANTWNALLSAVGTAELRQTGPTQGKGNFGHKSRKRTATKGTIVYPAPKVVVPVYTLAGP